MKWLEKMNNLRGRRVLITGGTGHLGRTLAETMAELGASIVLLDRPGSDFTGLERALTKIALADCQSIACDLEKEADRDRAIATIQSDEKGLSCLINNAALVGLDGLPGWNTELEKQSLSTWRRALEVNLTAAFHFSQAFVPELRAGPGGNIINITSIYGEFGPDWRLYEGTDMGNPAAYAASKGGLTQLTRWLAATLAPQVRVNGICPGGIFRSQPACFTERYQSKVPLGRMATEDDFRGAVSYLASDLSKYVTGQILHVDGGWGIW